MKVQMGLIVVALLVLVGCNTNSAAPTPTAMPTAEPPTPTAETLGAPASTPASSSANVTTYVDSRSGVAFDYPVGWTMIEPPADGGSIYSYSIASYDMTDPNNPSKGGESGIPFGQTKMDITFYGADETPDTARRTVQSDEDSGFAIVQKQETRTAPDGSPAYYYEIQGRLGGSARIIYTRINGQTVSVTVYGDAKPFEAVVKSLRAAS